MNIPSSILQNAVDQISNLPGIGKHSALRLALHLLKQPSSQLDQLSSSITSLSKDIKYCKSCYNISDVDYCHICENKQRNKEIICVVEDIRDVMAIEATSQYKGVYHVLGGKISPLEGIGPYELEIDSLIRKIENKQIKELIFALSATMEGDTTNHYIFNQISNKESIKISAIARGIGINDELAYADQITLGQSILQRVPFDQFNTSGSSMLF